jgi:hypothetical protein
LGVNKFSFFTERGGFVVLLTLLSMLILVFLVDAFCFLTVLLWSP